MRLQKLAARARLRLGRFLDPYRYERNLVTQRYQAVFKRAPDIDHPRLFTEKLVWLNLHYRNPLLPTLTDKLQCRSFVGTALGNTEALLPLLNEYERPADIDFNALPNEFVLKVTSGCGWNIFCRDKASLNVDRTRKQLSAWMKDSYFDKYREWPYRNPRPRIIAEPFISEDGHPQRSAPDCKIWCFNGKPRFVSICTDRRGDRRMDLHDCDTWEPLPYTFGAGRRRDEPFERPIEFDAMLRVARTLSRALPFVRVDLYPNQGRVIFGEMTLYPFAGFVPMNPSWADELLGSWLTLPTGPMVRMPKKDRGRSPSLFSGRTGGAPV